jgi:hypothetical protein
MNLFTNNLKSGPFDQQPDTEPNDGAAASTDPGPNRLAQLFLLWHFSAQRILISSEVFTPIRRDPPAAGVLCGSNNGLYGP